MIKRLILTLAIVLMLTATIALPAVAEEKTIDASVTVVPTDVISISLNDPAPSGIQFGSVTANATYGAQGQSNGTPAIQVVVESGTNVNVDIGIKGTTGGTLAISNWKYSTLFNQSDIASLTTSGTVVYSNKGVGSYAFYHWLTVPAETAAASYTASITYTAVKH